MNCEYCQSPVHIWFQCPKKPDGWKPARLAKEKPRPVNGMGSSHAAGLIPAEAVKSTAPQKGVDLGPEEVTGTAFVMRPAKGEMGAESPSVTAGTQALPVDTNSNHVENEGLQTFPSQSVISNTSAGTVGNKDRQPNSDPRQSGSNGAPVVPSGDGLSVSRLPSPKTDAKFDKKAWQRNYMRTYIRQYREDVKAGKRVPKKRKW